MKTYYSNINNFKDSTQELSDSAFTERYASFLSCINKDRQDHLLRFRHEDDRLRSLAGSVLLTNIVKNMQKENMDKNECSLLSKVVFPLSIEYESAGKPFLPDAPGFLFSISHSDLYAAVAVATSSECKHIGVDIQAKDRTNILDIADRFYTDLEKNLINSHNDLSEREDCFYRIWSAKEAFIKCNGKGLSYGISNFNADITNDIVTDLEGNILANIKKQTCPEGYVCYVCTDIS